MGDRAGNDWRLVGVGWMLVVGWFTCTTARWLWCTAKRRGCPCRASMCAPFWSSRQATSTCCMLAAITLRAHVALCNVIASLPKTYMVYTWFSYLLLFWIWI